LNHFNPAIGLKEGEGASNIAAMYAQRGKLEAIFNVFDTNGDGVSKIIRLSNNVLLYLFKYVLFIYIFFIRQYLVKSSDKAVKL
jgi:glucan phosphoethanolaminetransferase (alkaline phosphatase superfamily)